MTEYVCTKPCSCPIIIWSTEWMTGFRFYPFSDNEQSKLIKLNDFEVT